MDELIAMIGGSRDGCFFVSEKDGNPRVVLPQLVAAPMQYLKGVSEIAPTPTSETYRLERITCESASVSMLVVEGMSAHEALTKVLQSYGLSQGRIERSTA